MAVSVVDEFIIESSKRKVRLEKWPQLCKPWQIHVYARNFRSEWVLLSTSEYFDEDNARKDFERRRPQMRDASGEEFPMPMQKGQRLIQEVMREKLDKVNKREG